MTDQSPNGTTKPLLPFGLTLADVARVPFTAALCVAVVVLWFTLQNVQTQYVTLARSCPAVSVTEPGR